MVVEEPGLASEEAPKGIRCVDETDLKPHEDSGLSNTSKSKHKYKQITVIACTKNQTRLLHGNLEEM